MLILEADLGAIFLQKAAKIAGTVVVGKTIFDMVGDYNTYEGNDKYKAMGLTLGGTLVSGFAGAGLALVAPEALAIAGGILVCVGVGEAVT